MLWVWPNRATQECDPTRATAYTLNRQTDICRFFSAAVSLKADKLGFDFGF
jgi:hypothetical protein